MRGTRLPRAGLLGIGAGVDTQGDSGAAVAAALVAERLAEALCPAPYVGQGILAPALLAATGAASDAEAVAAGELRCCVLLTADLTRFASPDEPAVAFDALGASHGLTVDAGRRAAPAPAVTRSAPGRPWTAPASRWSGWSTTPGSCSACTRSTRPIATG